MDNRPLKPSIKFEPFIQQKHRTKKNIENNCYASNFLKTLNQIELMLNENKLIKIIKDIIINSNLNFGEILNSISSKNPNENKAIDIKIIKQEALENYIIKIKKIFRTIILANPPSSCN